MLPTTFYGNQKQPLIVLNFYMLLISWCFFRLKVENYSFFVNNHGREEVQKMSPPNKKYKGTFHNPMAMTAMNSTAPALSLWENTVVFFCSSIHLKIEIEFWHKKNPI